MLKETSIKKPHYAKVTRGRQVALIVLDGWGYREEKENNAIAEAKTPFFDELWENYPHSLLEASGLAVGLPEGQMGNSEVGHTTIGAGKIVYTDLVRISLAAKNGEFDTNETFQKLFAHALKNNSTLHLMGLIGPGGVHAHSEHLYEILKAAKRAGLKKVAIHAFTDGRDTPPQSAAGYLAELEEKINEIGIGFISTMTGRYFAMDRDNNWDRLKKAEDAIFKGEGMQAGNQKASDVAKLFYTKEKTDEHFEPVVFLNKEGQKELIGEKDAVFFWNFRADRARMLSEKITKWTMVHFGLFGTMTNYSKDLDCLVAFGPTNIETTLAKEISEAGLTQAHIAETEKFAHATYFLNGGEEKPYENEKHILVESRKDVATHDLAPEMRAQEIADKAIEEINKSTDFIFVNFANADMVGHTANKEAIIAGVEKVDQELRRVIEALEAKGGVAFITADHGNAEINVDAETGKKHTAHTLSPVPAILTDKNKKLKTGTLADIAPTVLAELEIEKPETMGGESLFD
ncbi:MAG: 2,3-bisphosphoglycerate-independent phosphoglycerate mutase [bacterium]